MVKPRKAKRQPKAIDLFCGCGGMTLGLRRAGFDVVGGIDLDPAALATYRANHPNVKVWEKDICKLTPSEVMAALALKPGELDLLAGCPPCQGFSTMTTLNGHFRTDDERNDLVLQFNRFIRAIRPRAVMMENVPALMDDSRFTKVVNTLERLNYQVINEVRNVADHGVPQRRRRMIMIATHGRTPKLAKPSRKQRTVAETIRSLPKAGQSGDPAHDHGEKRTDKIKRLIAMIPKDGGSRTDLPRSEQLDCHKRCNGFKDVYGRMKWDDVAPTITGGCFNPSKGRFLHPSENRNITIREAAMLQGFPSSYIFHSLKSKSEIAQMVGNALPPEFVRRHAAKLISHT